MILGFTQKIKGKPNYFVRKIWKGISMAGIKLFPETNFQDFNYAHKFKLGCFIDGDLVMKLEPKIHTIRKGNRWRAGMIIDFFINTRTKNMFRFAPKIPVKHVQSIRIEYKYAFNVFAEKTTDKYPHIYIDEKLYNPFGFPETFFRMRELSINDGFENQSEFYKYFNTNFEGQIIHWTDKKY